MQLKVVPGYYPGFIEIQGASFKISIVLSANDIRIEQGLQRQAEADKIAKATNAYDSLVAELRNILAASPKTFDLPREEFNEEFQAWVKNRCRHLLDQLGERHA